MTHGGLHHGRSVTHDKLRRKADSTCLGHGYLLTRYQKGRHGNKTLASLPLAGGVLMTSLLRLSGILARLFVSHA